MQNEGFVISNDQKLKDQIVLLTIASENDVINFRSAFLSLLLHIWELWTQSLSVYVNIASDEVFHSYEKITNCTIKISICV